METNPVRAWGRKDVLKKLLISPNLSLKGKKLHLSFWQRTYACMSGQGACTYHPLSSSVPWSHWKKHQHTRKSKQMNTDGITITSNRSLSSDYWSNKYIYFFFSFNKHLLFILFSLTLFSFVSSQDQWNPELVYKAIAWKAEKEIFN